MLNSREAFKVGFLQRCADAGLDAEETQQAIKEAVEFVKNASLSDFLSKPYEKVLDVIGNTASHAGQNVGNLGLTAMVLGPAAAGLAGGYGLSRLGDVDDTDVNAIKQRELIDEYYRQIDLMRSKKRGLFKRPQTPGQM